MTYGYKIVYYAILLFVVTGQEFSSRPSNRRVVIDSRSSDTGWVLDRFATILLVYALYGHIAGLCYMTISLVYAIYDHIAGLCVI